MDQAICEWNPGSNRSVVSIEIAAQRLPVADRELLIYKHNARKFDDQVIISQYSVIGSAQYDGHIYDMNFSTGYLCHTVTREKWSERNATAMVYWISETVAYGWAADCGNLFRLVRIPDSLYKLDKKRTIERELGLDLDETVLQRWYRLHRAEKVRELPEPSTLLLTLPMVLAVLLRNRRKKT